MSPFNPKTTAFVFPGQGSQKVGMGQALAAAYSKAQAIFERGDNLLGFSISKLAWEGPEDELNDTINTQPALLVHSVAALRVFNELYPDFEPAYVAGHSLGELSALVACGALHYQDAVPLVRRRGELMKQAGEENPGGMAAILGAETKQVDMACVDASTNGQIAQIANDNCPGQIVISGHKEAVERAMESAKEFGAKRALPLAVSIAAHSPLMASVQKDFAETVKATAITDPGIPIIGNVSAEAMYDADAIRTDLEGQLTARVRWTETIEFLIGEGIDTFVELGSGNVLTGLLKRIDSSVTGIALGEPEDFEKLSNS